MLSAALAQAFPPIPRTEFHHQTRFVVRIGHEEFDVDGGGAWSAAGRADIILYHNERPLAVVELKRSDLALTDADRRQAQSYANQITPRPPLVIVTNGTDCIIYDSSTGETWTPTTNDQRVVARLFENAATVAKANLDWAVGVLMGPDGGIWPSAVRARTRALIDQFSGEAADRSKPFVTDFLIPRFATMGVAAALAQGRAVVLVTGAPAIGKSNVLREFAERMADSLDYAILMIRAGAPGVGLFQRIANLLSAALEWAVTKDDVRQWIRRLSNSSYGPSLVLTIDGLVAGSSVAVEIEELAEAGFGPRLKIVATTDDARGLLSAANGRDATAVAGIVGVIEMDSLNEAEFRKAQEALLRHRVSFTKGAVFSAEYRVPWILRALLASVTTAAEHKTSGARALASLGVWMVDAIRSRFHYADEVAHGYRLLAQDFVADVIDMSGETALEISNGFVVRRQALRQVAREVLPALTMQGWVTSYRHRGGDDLIAPRVPELFLSETAWAVSEELERRMAVDPKAAGQWLADRMEGVFLGDIIGAQAVRDLATRRRGFSSGLPAGLFDRKPTADTFDEGLIAIQGNDGELQNIWIKGGKAFLADDAGQPHGEPVDISGDPLQRYSHTLGWMILAQLARVPAVADGTEGTRVDASLLLEIGTCPFPLMRAQRDPVGHFVHEIEGHGSVLCPDNGVIEPMTAAMHQLFLHEWNNLDKWFDDALARNSLALLNRVLIALREVKRTSDEARKQWARGLLERRVDPAIAAKLAAVKRSRAGEQPRTVRSKRASRGSRTSKRR